MPCNLEELDMYSLRYLTMSGKKLTRGMKVYLNHDSYTMRVRGQHIKPELKGTGATHYGQSIEQSTHLRVYIDKK